MLGATDCRVIYYTCLPLGLYQVAIAISIHDVEILVAFAWVRA